MLCHATNFLWMLISDVFYVFWLLKSQKIFPTRALPWTPCWVGLTAPGGPICFLHYVHVLYSYNLGAFSLTDVEFCSVLKPGVELYTKQTACNYMILRGKTAETLNTIICKGSVLAASDYCLHNQFLNSIEFHNSAGAFEYLIRIFG